MSATTCQTVETADNRLYLAELPKLRKAIRGGRYDGHTRGLARGKLQANLVVLPRWSAQDFQQFCLRNPKACPLIGVGRYGSPLIPALGEIDVRIDAPQYDVLCFGQTVNRVGDLHAVWRDHFAAFALGSSNTFEDALSRKGITFRCDDRPAPLFRSKIRTVPVGSFRGEMVVSMRPVRRNDIDKVRAVTARYPHAHGSPIHVGDPQVIGVDLRNPSWGEPIQLRHDEVAAFWASGMTARVALEHAKPEIAVTHTYGHMMITDIDAHADVGMFRVF